MRHSTLNSEHFPQPTQQIKHIIRQYQQPPRGSASALCPTPDRPPSLYLPTGPFARACLYLVVQVMLPCGVWAPRGPGQGGRSLELVPVAESASRLTRKDGGKGFVKRPDPHEEALTLLKGQMTHLTVAPGTQVTVQGGGGTEDREGQLASHSSTLSP